MVGLTLTALISVALVLSVAALFYAQSSSERRLRRLLLATISALVPGMTPTKRQEHQEQIGPFYLKGQALTLSATLNSGDDGFELTITAPLNTHAIDWLLLDASAKPLSPQSAASLDCGNVIWRAPLKRILAALLDDAAPLYDALTFAVLPQARGQLHALRLEHERVSLRLSFDWRGVSPAQFEPAASQAIGAVTRWLATLATAMTEQLPDRPWALWLKIFYQSWDDPEAQRLALGVLMTQCPGLASTQAALQAASEHSFGPVFLASAPSAQLEPLLDKLSVARLLSIYADALQDAAAGQGLRAPQTMAALTTKLSARLNDAQTALPSLSAKDAVALVPLWSVEPTRRRALAQLIARCWEAWGPQAQQLTISALIAQPSEAWTPLIPLFLRGFHARGERGAQLLHLGLEIATAWPEALSQDAIAALFAQAAPGLDHHEAQRWSFLLGAHAPPSFIGALHQALNAQPWADPKARALIAQRLTALLAQHQSHARVGALSLDASPQTPRGQLSLTEQHASAGDLAVLSAPQETQEG